MSDTGYFPSTLADGRPRKHGSGHQLKELRVRCIKDGMVRTFVDDGFDAKTGTPNQSRQVLTRAIGREEDGLPVFFLDADAPKVAPFTTHGGMKVHPRRANEAAVEKMVANVQKRDARAKIAEEFADRHRKALAEATAKEVRQSVSAPAQADLAALEARDAEIAELKKQLANAAKSDPPPPKKTGKKGGD